MSTAPATPARLIDLATECGREWADQHWQPNSGDTTPEPWTGLTPDDCAWIEHKEPDLCNQHGPATAEAERAARVAYWKKLAERAAAENWPAAISAVIREAARA